ncbi:DUF625-domain-containing protein [Tilletiaria anomala UBC 951]|uniref:DUF625-domain-containing protein n=1 Tax=Tilletiaria anomala (strain ATCC 24038 / CBS 436.72 / UBC 951) TaxID=1037660 RepID=A0A066VTX4_TILAU|nr:DUF625-domain-containing protein [Tilletiaria anomala UBC 951]KDN44901.1 DUF625-domain-containing protein [Tilletiaria anomala UBC 951]
MVDADSSSGEISFEQRPASTGDISAGSSSTGEISLTDMTIPEHEHLSPAATISRGLYHQCGTARRVKVYELQNDNWFDHGTGYCAGVYDEEHDQALLVAKSEELCQYMSLPPPPAEDENREPGGIPRAEEEDLTSQYIIVVSAQLSPEEVLLCTQVVREDIYQRQQDTLIVWTEPGGKDMALSFQEAEGCNEIWEFLSEVQKHFKINGKYGADDGDSSEPGQPMSRELGFEESFQTGEEMLSMVEGDHILPEPTLGNVEQIDFAVRELASRPPQFRERFAEWLLKTGYIKSMIELFHDAEDLEQLGVLHSLCSIMQNLLLLNDTVMFEWILQDNVFLGVVGMLEYDPVFPRDKASFRQYLSDPGRFRQVVPITDANILTKIHHTYRLHYLKDVILARILEDATFSTLQSILFFYQVDIVSYCGGNEDFLRRLFAVFKTSAQRGDAAAEQHKRDGVIFLQQLCNMGKTIQLHSRISLYHTLVEWGLIDVIEFAFDAGDATLRNAAAEMLIVIIEYDANSVRLRILELKDKKERTLMAILIEHLHRDGDMGLKSQIVEILRTLLDCGDGSNTTASQAMMQQQVLGNKQGPKADPERFLTAFYEEDCELLLAPLKQLPDVMTLPRRSRLPPMSLSRSALFGHLCDLLCFISTCHGFRSQYFVITSEVSKKVATLLRSRDKHVRCASLRFFKACLANNNQFINRHHIKIELFETLLDIVEEEADRDNLVTSACISYFEYMKQEAVMKPLINHIAEKNQPALQRLARHSTAGKVFSELLSRWEQSSSSLASSKALIQTNEDARRVPPKRRGATTKAMEAEAEESYFHDDQEPEASGSEAKVITPVPNLVPYADDDFDFDVTPSSTPSQNSGSSSTPDAQGSASVAETSIEDAPMLRLGEKRRREEDEDALDMLSAKRKQAPPSTDASADAEPQAKRQNQDGSSPAASTILGDTEGGFIREEAQEVLALLPSQAAGPIPVSSEPSLSPRVPGPASSNTKKVSLALSQSAIKMAQDSSTGDGEKGRKEAARDGSGS